MPQPNRLIVCPTSHMDWDWLGSFEEYYKLNVDVDGSDYDAVQAILTAAGTQFPPTGPSSFSVAEVAWLKRYLVDQDSAPPVAKPLGALCLMGGAVTSPDNILCDGEVFVRAYLVGRQWARSAGLGASLTDVSWMPDDFGHDPELPLILSAMGLSAAAFARVPGAFPNYNMIQNTEDSLACQLMASGVAFNWKAGDNSTVLAHFMPFGYGLNVSGDPQAIAGTLELFVQSKTPSSYPCAAATAVQWPGGIAFAPAGGDFVVPNSQLSDGISTFNDQNKGTVAHLGTFAEYVAAVQELGAGLSTLSIDPSNFWTGHFGSRPELKTLQAVASRALVAAESVSSLLRLGSQTSGAALDALDAAIGRAWDLLVPSSHHDFVNGTSPDRVYKMEQLPLLLLAANTAREVHGQAIQIIADSIPAGSVDPKGEGTVVAVHNPIGIARTGVFRLETGAAVNFASSGPATVQPLAGGGLLVQAPAVPSLGYVSGLVTSLAWASPRGPALFDDQLTLDNGTLAITIARGQSWAITSIVPAGGSNVLPGGLPANQLAVYEDTGNLYQFGNEPLLPPPQRTTGTFAKQAGAFSAGPAVQTEFGPLRWRVEAPLTWTDGTSFRVAYTLVAGESLVRVSVTGAAPASSTVVTEIPALATDGTTKGTHLIYGTAHHFHEDQAPSYWDGPTFKATHHFLMPAAAAPATFALAAIYHGGMPAWACEDGTLLGSLFRNTDGTQRGAAGTDADVHTQRFAIRISAQPLDPAKGVPLVEALQFSNPLRARLASTANRPESPVTLPASASLASAPPPALVRASRPMGEAASPVGPPILGRVAIRIYRPDADGTPATVPVTLPVLQPSSRPTAVLVTALEDPIANAPAVTVQGNTLNVPTRHAITTTQVTVTRPTSQMTNGK